MSELKKGDFLYNTDMKYFAYFSHEVEDGIMVTNVAPIPNISLPTFHWCKEDTVSVTRPQVEAYLKEKGWVWKDNHTTDDEGKPMDCSHFGKKKYMLWLDVYGEWYVSTPAIKRKDFDTAPAQLQEAITMARLLNATKP